MLNRVCLPVIYVTHAVSLGMHCLQFSAGQIWIGALDKLLYTEDKPWILSEICVFFGPEIPSLSFFSLLYLISAYILDVDVHC